MANQIITPTLIAAQALENLYQQTILAQLVHRDLDREFAPGRGATVNMKVPASFTAQDYNRTTRTITLQDATERKLPVVVDRIKDVSFEVTSEELAMDIVDFNTQLLMPATEAIAQAIDATIAAELLAASTQAAVAASGETAGTAAGGGKIGAGAAGSAMTDPLLLRTARKVLNQAAVPMTGRAAVYSHEAEAGVLGDEHLVDNSRSGSNAALREGTVGRLYGFDGYHSGNLADDASLAFWRDAYALIMRPMPVPKSVNGRSIARDGFAVRVTQSWDQGRKAEVCSVDVLFGTKVLRPEAITNIVASA
ncbi:MAG: hypothetical protein KDB16_12105 [Acidimicrobiales bacterium]|nr:hypothetical protein [Acidimicrobiales bacterium]